MQHPQLRRVRVSCPKLAYFRFIWSHYKADNFDILLDEPLPGDESFVH